MYSPRLYLRIYLSKQYGARVKLLPEAAYFLLYELQASTGFVKNPSEFLSTPASVFKVKMLYLRLKPRTTEREKMRQEYLPWHIRKYDYRKRGRVNSTHPGAAQGLGRADVLGPAEGFAAGVAACRFAPPALSLPTMSSLACIMGSWTSCRIYVKEVFFKPKMGGEGGTHA